MDTTIKHFTMQGYVSWRTKNKFPALTIEQYLEIEKKFDYET